MNAFTEIINTMDTLSYDEMEEMSEILKKRLIEKRRDEILAASEQAMKESKEGKTVTVESREQLIQYFNNLMNEKD